jgi:hypothetical protein
MAGLLICSFIASIISVVTASGGRLPKEIRTAISVVFYCGIIIPGTVAFVAKNEPVLAKGFWYDHPTSDIAAFVRNNPGNGNIFIWGNHSNAYLLPGVSPTVRYVDLQPFFFADYVNDRLVNSLLSDLDQAKPEFIFDVSSYDGLPPLTADGNIAPVSGSAAAQGFESTNYLKPIFAYVAQNYRLVPDSSNARLVVYKRISG